MNVFDIVGPVMIGPSSSHTAGAARIGRVASKLLGNPAVRAEIVLHGSFAKTYKGHGTDKALIAGIMGMEPDDSRLRESPRLAKEQGLEVSISTDTIEDAHPNTARITLTDAKGKQICVQGASVGGGNILITKVDGMDVAISGQHTTLVAVHKDAPGVIAAVTDYMSGLCINICNFRLSRSQKGGTAVMTIEVDGNLEESANEDIQKLPNVIRSTLIQLN